MVIGAVLAASLAFSSRPVEAPRSNAAPTLVDQDAASKHRAAAIGLLAGAVGSGAAGVAAGVLFTQARGPCHEADCIGNALGQVGGGLGMAVFLPTTGVLSALSGTHWGRYRVLRAEPLDEQRLRRRRVAGIVSLALGWAAVVPALTTSAHDEGWVRTMGTGLFAASHVARWIGLGAVVSTEIQRKSGRRLTVLPNARATASGWHAGVSASGRF